MLGFLLGSEDPFTQVKRVLIIRNMTTVNVYPTLTAEQETEIRARYEAAKTPDSPRVTVKSLAAEYNVTKRTIRKALGKVKSTGYQGVKLDPDKVRSIRAQWALPQGERPSKRQLAHDYGVHPVNIHYIVTGKTWKDA